MYKYTGTHIYNQIHVHTNVYTHIYTDKKSKMIVFGVEPLCVSVCVGKGQSIYFNTSHLNDVRNEIHVCICYEEKVMIGNLVT